MDDRETGGLVKTALHFIGPKPPTPFIPEYHWSLEKDYNGDPVVVINGLKVFYPNVPGSRLVVDEAALRKLGLFYEGNGDHLDNYEKDPVW